MNVKRIDQGRFDRLTLTPEGYLKGKVYATRTGIFNYLHVDGSMIKEFRPPEEVLSVASMDSLKEKIVTNDHPREFLNSSNTKNYNAGHIGDKITQDGDWLVANVTITDKQLIDAIQNGKQEVSCGYTCDVYKEPGIHKSEKYDFVQKNINYNHISFVDRGRAGPEGRIRFDANNCAIMVSTEKKVDKQDESNIDLSENQNQNEEQDRMSAKIRIDSTEYEVSESVALVVNQKLNEIEELKKENSKLAGKADALEVKVSESDNKIKELEASKMNKADLIEQATHLINLKSSYEAVTGKKLDLTKFDKAEVEKEILEAKKDIISKKTKIDSFEGKSNEYIDGMFEVISASKDSEHVDELKDEVSKNARSDSKEKRDAKAEMDDLLTNAYKSKLKDI